ncbi:hypothetical protein RchiOBHm_Chr1g0368691 [Rosa chinensis]|uniref:Uncharacterized protein n=1 Tax=Rosa chinensis TaxID=74649 RepID=A0A2P6SKV5_ROSCH|nr:uncharacterized protein LOC112170866 [Rosa chinensis]PRQ59302.1 hypothetical protein RchiOBHm_Chr1g0368691 [Rosa chinensis]
MRANAVARATKPARPRRRADLCYNYPSSQHSHYQTPVLVENPSFSKDNEDDDPLPGIDCLQIPGEALPGCELQACGYLTKGATSCNFQWVRHHPDGSFHYINGETKPKYLITADDVDAYLAIEVEPLDDQRNRKGELEKVFANKHHKISFGPKMQYKIHKILFEGEKSLRVFHFTRCLNKWQSAMLVIKRRSYRVEDLVFGGVSVILPDQKFSLHTVVSIPSGSPLEFMISDFDSSCGEVGDHLFKLMDTSIYWSRDVVVLILRSFIQRVVQKSSSEGKGKLEEKEKTKDFSFFPENPS